MAREGVKEENQSSAKVREKFSYGWIVAVASGIAIMAGSNIQYTFGVFVKPLTNKFGWSRAAISGAVSGRSMVQSILSPIVGALSDRYGSKQLIILGICLAGLGYLLFSRLSSLWQLYVLTTLLIGTGSIFVTTPAIVAVTKWFGGKGGLANGIALSGHSLAQIIMPPLATYLFLKYGWITCFVILGPAIWIVGGIAWLFIRMPPSLAGQVEAVPRADGRVGEKTSEQGSFTRAEALRTRTLWVMVTIYMIVATCYQLVVIHIVPAATDVGITPEAAAIILTLSGVGNTTGRLLFGLVASKIGNRTALVLCLGTQALLFFLLIGVRSLYLFYAILTVYGLVYGGATPLMPTITGSYFGTKSVGSIYGIVSSAYNVGGVIGPFLAGYVFDITGNYRIAFLLAGIVSMLAVLSCLLLKPPVREALAA